MRMSPAQVCCLEECESDGAVISPVVLLPLSLSLSLALSLALSLSLWKSFFTWRAKTPSSPSLYSALSLDLSLRSFDPGRSSLLSTPSESSHRVNRSAVSTSTTCFQRRPITEKKCCDTTKVAQSLHLVPTVSSDSISMDCNTCEV